MESRNGLHKTVRCKVCGKRTRSDNLKRHMGSHKDILAMDDNEVREELRVRQSVHAEREERR